MKFIPHLQSLNTEQLFMFFLDSHIDKLDDKLKNIKSEIEKCMELYVYIIKRIDEQLNKEGPDRFECHHIEFLERARAYVESLAHNYTRFK